MSLPPPDAAKNAPSTAPAHAAPVPIVRKTPAAPVIDEPDLDSYGDLLRDAFIYPWRRGGAFILIPGTVLSLAFSVSLLAPLIGLISAALGACYFSAFYFQIVETTYAGKHQVPDWPELSDLYDDLIRPGLHMLLILFYCVALICLANEAIALVAGESENDAVNPATLWFGRVLVSVYFPMAVLGVVLQGHAGAALPHRVLSAIVRTCPGYLLGAGVLLAIELGINWLSDALIDWSLLGILPARLLGICLLVVQARLTGTLGIRYAARIA